MSFRTQTPGTEYLIGYNGSLTFASFVGGSLSVIGTQSPSPAFDITHKYTLDAQVTGTNPTTLMATITDDNTSTVVATATFTDSTPSLQQSGQFGMFANNGSVASDLIDNVVYYDDLAITAATSYTLSGPGSVNVSSASSNFTVSPNGVYTGTITPSDGAAGGTFTPSSLTFASSSAPQTFTYTSPTTGTKTISTASSPAITNPSSLSVSVVDPTAGLIGITNTNLVWSPYDWHFNGSTWAETQPGGGYVKIAFTGSTLGINVDTTALAVSTSGVGIHAYIDGTTTPISKTLADASGNQIIFTNSLAAGNHYAIIYNSVTPCNCNNRYTDGANSLRITSLQLASNGTILSLSSTPLAQQPYKVLFYGDSITEGYDDSGAENSYAARLGRLLGVEYGQVGYRSGGYETAVDGGSTTFYNIGNTAGSWYANYDNDTSRLNGGVLSGGYKDGTPDAVFNNLGINDAAPDAGTTTLRTKMMDWLTDERTILGTYPAIIMLMPFSLSDPNSTNWTSAGVVDRYKAAMGQAIADYQAANPNDHRVYNVDLGPSGFATFASNIVESVHPNDAGAAQIATLLNPLVSGYLIKPVTTVSSVSSTASSTGASVTWNTDAVGSSYLNFGLTSSYGATTTEADNATTTRTMSHSIILSSLAPCTLYHYRTISRDVAFDVASSSDHTFTTSCTGSASVSATMASNITTGSGGTIALGSASVNVPAGYSGTTTSATFQANQLDSTAFFTGAGTPSGVSRVGSFVLDLKALINATTTLPTFTQPISVTISYDPNNLGGVSASTLKIYRYDSGTGWTALTGCTVDTVAHTVTCQTSNFSDFSLFGVATTASSSSHSSVTSGSGIVYGCKDPNATNYNEFSASKPSLCVYAQSSPVLGQSSEEYVRDLTLKSTGSDVTALQTFLIAKGYLAAGNATGYFGAMTQAALMRYQVSVGITPATGYFGPITRMSLSGQGGVSTSIPSTVAASTTVSADVSSAVGTFTRDLTINSTGTDVQALQAYLNTHGYAVAQSGPGSSGNETQMFGYATQAALARFQQAMNITPATGYFGPKTRTVITAGL